MSEDLELKDGLEMASEKEIDFEAFEQLRRKTPQFWQRLTRVLNENSVAEFAKDDKLQPVDGKLRIYVPPQYVSRVRMSFQGTPVKVERLQLFPMPSPRYINQLAAKPGILFTATDELDRPLPYVVPGGRFNELYGWDTYFIGVGLLLDNMLDMASNLVRHQIFEIEHYGKVLNANRTYYLGRSQPPLMLELAIKIFERTNDTDLLISATKAAISEYDHVWMSSPRLDRLTGLSKYAPPLVKGIPPETEPGHFDHILKPLAERHQLSVERFTQLYNNGELVSPELDEFLRHDQGMRESGHDSSSRLEGVCADLATVDLNVLLYKCERNIAWAIRRLPPGTFLQHTDDVWQEKSNRRRLAIHKYMWSEEESMFYDYNCNTRRRHTVGSATTFWTLWAGVASNYQVEKMVRYSLPKFEFAGGLAGTPRPTTYSFDTKQRQWDYPYGWAPHQILAWLGLLRFGFFDVASRLAVNWAQVILNVYQEHGSIMEKYNVVDTEHAHLVEAEYGNQGNAEEGFGWTNTSLIFAWELFLCRYQKRRP